MRRRVPRAPASSARSVHSRRRRTSQIVCRLGLQGSEPALLGTGEQPVDKPFVDALGALDQQVPAGLDAFDLESLAGLDAITLAQLGRQDDLAFARDDGLHTSKIASYSASVNAVSGLASRPASRWCWNDRTGVVSSMISPSVTGSGASVR